MKFMFAASNNSSIAMSKTTKFFRFRKIPTTLIEKRIAPRTR